MVPPDSLSEQQRGGDNSFTRERRSTHVGTEHGDEGGVLHLVTLIIKKDALFEAPTLVTPGRSCRPRIRHRQNPPCPDLLVECLGEDRSWRNIRFSTVRSLLVRLLGRSVGRVFA